MSLVNFVISDRLKKVKPSASIAAKDRVDALRAAGKEIIDFTHGEPDFPTPAHIIDAGVNSLVAGKTRYAASAGVSELRKAIADKLISENDVNFSPAHIVVGSGAKQILFNTFAATLNPGDEVIVPAPYWVSYPEMVIISDGIPVIVECDISSGFKLTPSALDSAISEKTRWVILNSPNNPTGAVYSKEELSALGDVLLKYPHVWVISDELYEHIIYEGKKHVSIVNTTPALLDRTLIINGASKTYAMTGWRLGYGAGPIPLIKAITLLISQSTTCVSPFSQEAFISALQGNQSCVRQAQKKFETRRNMLISGLRSIDGISVDKPDGAFYLLVSVQKLLGRSAPNGDVLKTDRDVANYFIDQVGLVSVDGTSYGLPGYLRLSFATSDEIIKKGVIAMKLAVEALI
ncbi:aminotransferase class I/II-fold pyridoxal phosphate-dependent enzyme [Enterobacteriaceae bacterium RIT697]|uniref:pyridoxal phosphate-dependent aminotransferase n=1 Tax=Pantoea endophytica TaxID=92488 RepID=UPI0012AE6A8B|nr:pyridoxal phosphate-dependent aminotransferase [Pantoea endophytica]MRT24959.1 aminotransferase class I/II-fold pyridoxal phosphate-dependent enzyme [Enterobacteriaceae bacterium RIT697]